MRAAVLLAGLAALAGTPSAVALPPILDRVVSPAYIRLEKYVAGKQIPNAVSVPGRRRLGEAGLGDRDTTAADHSSVLPDHEAHRQLRFHPSS